MKVLDSNKLAVNKLINKDILMKRDFKKCD